MNYSFFDFSEFKYSDSSQDILPTTDNNVNIKDLFLIVNLLPLHPFDFNQLYIEKIMDLLSNNTDCIEKLKQILSKDRIYFVFHNKKSSHAKSVPAEIRKNSIFIEPFYPITTKLLKQKLKIKTDSVSILNWFEFYNAIAHCNKILLHGIPVSISFPAENRYYAAVVPKGECFQDVYNRIDSVNKLPDWNSQLCIDHPFTGRTIEKEFLLEELKPYTFIFIPNNSRKKISIFEQIKLMIFESAHFRFQNRFYSHPKLLGTPCQKCLHCTKICPEKLVPFMLAALYSNEQIKDASKFEPEKCIECGCCTYVCPSGIPLLHQIKMLKKTLGVNP